MQPELHTEIEEARSFVRTLQRQGKSVGLVPTMGALHEGHLSLVRASNELTDVTVATIFVNPIQFGPAEDLKNYPRTLDSDLNALGELGVKAVFTPTPEVMYPDGEPLTHVVPSGLDQNLCGRVRPGHFRGVCTVVTKLFNILPADHAFFGRKDAQQAAILQRMARDLDIPTRVHVCPIVRESDGLAMSSRNRYLSPEERAQAVGLSRALKEARSTIADGERKSAAIVQTIRTVLGQLERVQPDYISVVDFSTFRDIDVVQGTCLVAIAAQVGPARLIDNMLVEGDTGVCDL